MPRNAVRRARRRTRACRRQATGGSRRAPARPAGARAALASWPTARRCASRTPRRQATARSAGRAARRAVRFASALAPPSCRRARRRSRRHRKSGGEHSSGHYSCGGLRGLMGECGTAAHAACGRASGRQAGGDRAATGRRSGRKRAEDGNALPDRVTIAVFRARPPLRGGFLDPRTPEQPRSVKR